MPATTHIDWTNGTLPTNTARVMYSDVRLPKNGPVEGFIDFTDDGPHPEAGDTFTLDQFLEVPSGIRCVARRVDPDGAIRPEADRVYFTGVVSADGRQVVTPPPR